MAINVNGGALEFDAVINDSQFKRTIDQMQRDLRNLSASTIKQSESMESFANKATAAVGAFFSIQAASNFVQSMVQVRGEFQKLEVSFQTMLKSKEAADKLMAESVKLAAVTPFTLQEVATGAKQLLAYGFSAKTVTENLEMLGNVASGVGAPLGDIVYLYGTLQTQGRAYTKDIMQFSSRGIPIIGELAKQFGVSKEEVQGLVEAGKVGFPQVEKAFKAMTGSSGLFFNLMQEQSKTLTGQLSNLSDAWQRMLNDMGKSNEGLFANSISTAISLVDNYEKVVDILGVLVLAYGSYRAALVAEAAIKQIVAARTVGMTAAEMLRYSQLTLLTAAQRAYNIALAASPVILYTAAIGALVGAIYSLTQAVDVASETQDKLNQVRNDSADAAEDENRKITQLTDVLKSQTSTVDQKKSAYDKLQAATNGVLKGYTAEQIAAGKAKGSIEEYIKTIQEATKSRKAFSEFNELAERMDDLNRKGIESIGTFRRIGTGLSNAWEIITGGKSAAEVIVSNERSSIKGQMDALKKEFGAKWNEIITGVTQDPSNQPKTRSETFIKNEIKRLEDLRSGLDLHSKKYKDYTKQINALNEELINAQGKLTKEQKNTAEDRKRLLEDLTKAEQEAFAKSLTQNEKEVQEARNKYNKLRDEAKKAGLGGGVNQRIDNAEKRETGDIQFRQETDILKEELEKQKVIFSDFENWKKDTSEESAKERFGKEKAQFDNYGDYIQAQMAILMATSVGIPTGPVQERLVLLSKLFKEFQDTQKEQRDADFKAAYDTALTLNQNIDKINQEYSKKADDLRKGSPGKNIDSNIEQLKLEREAAIDSAKEEAFQKTEIYRKLSEDIVIFSKQQAEGQIAAIEYTLNTAKSLSPELKKSLQVELDKAKSALSQSSNKAYEQDLKDRKALLEESLATQVLTTKEYEKQKRELAKINGELASMPAKKFDQLSGDLGSVSGSFFELSNAVGDSNEGLADTLGTLGEITGIASNAAGSVASFMSGDIIGGVTKGISAIAGILSLGKKSRDSERKAAEELKQIQDELLLGELAYNQAMRERIRSQSDMTDLTKEELEIRKEMLKVQAEQADKDFNELYNRIVGTGKQVTGSHTEKYGGVFGLGRKTRVVQETAGLNGASFDELERLFLEGKLTDETAKWVEELIKVKNETQAISDEAEETAKIITDKLTGGLKAESISSTIIEGFKSGKRAVADFADDIESFISKALLSALSYQYLEQPLKDIVSQMGDDVNSGGIWDESERAWFKDKVNESIQTGLDVAEEISKGTGIDLFGGKTATNQNSLEGSIKANLTEETGSVIAGQFSGLRLTAVDHLNVGRQSLAIITSSLAVQQQIEKNTRLTAERLEETNTRLRNIETKTVSNSTLLESNGL